MICVCVCVCQPSAQPESHPRERELSVMLVRGMRCAPSWLPLLCRRPSVLPASVKMLVEERTLPLYTQCVQSHGHSVPAFIVVVAVDGGLRTDSLSSCCSLSRLCDLPVC